MKYYIFMFFLFVLFSVKAIACVEDTVFVWKPIDLSEKATFINKEDSLDLFAKTTFISKVNSIELSRAVIVNEQLDSILFNVTKNLKNLDEDTGLCFYVTFMKYDANNSYIEIVEDYPNTYLFDITEKGHIPHQKEIYGYVQYNNVDFYLLLYPSNTTQAKDLIDLVKKTDDKINIRKKTDDYYPFHENPIWLYLYNDGNIKFLKSLNDKGFFTNP